jgi:VIT1/CCC1 family predicted Fe2+/Mn2+ transporter
MSESGGTTGDTDAVAGAERGGGTDGRSSGSGASDGGRRGRRDVVVPMRLYKTVTVFSTLGAVVAVVVGFVLLDAATGTGGIVRVLASVILVGVAGVDVGVLDAWFRTLRPVFAVLGLVSIGLGAGVYILGSRFRTEGMGNAQDDPDEPSSDG